MKNSKKAQKKLSSTEIEELFQLQTRHRHLRHRIRNPEKWMPRYLMEYRDAKPQEVLRDLKSESNRVWKRLKALSAKGEVPIPQRIPGPDETLPPLKDRIKQHIAEARMVENLKKMTSQVLVDLTIGEAPPPEEPDVVEGLGWGLESIDLMEVYSYEPGDDYTEFMHDEWKFDPYISADFRRLDFRTDIKRCDYGRLCHQAAMVINACGTAPFDGLFVWQANSLLNVPYRLNADDASFRADWFICQQHNRTRDPYNYEFYSIAGLNEDVSDGRNVGVWSREQLLNGVVAVQAGDNPAVYLGVSVDIEVEDDGRAGTKWDWGSLVIQRPANYDSWGIEFSYIRT
jgi:hypothetical protein